MKKRGEGPALPSYILLFKVTPAVYQLLVLTRRELLKGVTGYVK